MSFFQARKSIPCYNSIYHLARINQYDTVSEVLQRFTIESLVRLPVCNSITFRTLVLYRILWFDPHLKPGR